MDRDGSVMAQEDAEMPAELEPISLTSVTSDQAQSWLAAMTLIREFETVAESLVASGKIVGGMHSSAGQEAVAVGVLTALRHEDVVAATHRSHHVCLAKGLDPPSLMAELFGKATGCCGGRGGHMHLADISRNYFGSNGIVGAAVGIALGAALASSYLDRSQVAVGFVGDGGVNTGRVWESVNLAAVWELPLVIVCENNLYAVETSVARATAGDSISRRAAGFGLPTHVVDGQDVAAVHRVAAVAVERARHGDGPTFIEAQTYRYGGHDVGDRETYRTRLEVKHWRATRDPILRLGEAMICAGFTTRDDIDGILADARREVAAAVDFAESSPLPDPATVTQGVTELPLRMRSNR